ncbi:DUF1715-domain-containing protein [Hesseltinella vesiculosa]|uniref:DUF1715-domain-containing protein n=1 Tax=Hesseltinella vesiculosa TaxID=101127 RepID=A0A1X2GN89_9FUNG|nr:DUF1715-domain-containing protein [Hesseltinella vesiculosa]
MATPAQSQVERSQDLDSLCHLETVFQEHGYDDGYRAGEQSGELEGRLHGCEKACELGREIGFYQGCIDGWQELALLHGDKINPRALRHMEALRNMIAEFPRTNDATADMYGLRDKMKNKYRVIVSLLRVQHKYNMTDAPKLNF